MLENSRVRCSSPLVLPDLTALEVDLMLVERAPRHAGARAEMDKALSFGTQVKRTAHQVRWSGESGYSSSSTSDPTGSWLGATPLMSDDDDGVDGAASLDLHDSFFAASDSCIHLGESNVTRHVMHAWTTLPFPNEEEITVAEATQQEGAAAAAATGTTTQVQARDISSSPFMPALSASHSSGMPPSAQPPSQTIPQPGSSAPAPTPPAAPVLDEQRLTMLRSLRDQAHAKLRQGDFACTVALLDAADALHPNDACTLKYRGSAKCGLEQLQQALLDLDRADALAPNDAFTLRQRGEVKRGLGLYVEAVADLSRADALQPRHAWTLKRRGAALRCLGRLAEAVADLDQANALEPRDAFTLRQRGAAKCGMGLYAGALRDLNDADRVRPNDAFTLRQRGEVHRCMVQLPAALADLDRAHALEPRDAFTLRQRAWVRLKLGTEVEAVVADLDEADRLEPRNAHTLKLRGVALYKQQRFTEALDDLKRAVELGLGTDAELVRFKRKAELQLAVTLSMPEGLLRVLAPQEAVGSEPLAKLARVGSSSSPRGAATNGGRRCSSSS